MGVSIYSFAAGEGLLFAGFAGFAVRRDALAERVRFEPPERSTGLAVELRINIFGDATPRAPLAPHSAPQLLGLH